MRDIEGAYRDATIAEYESLKGAGRDAEAAHVAEVLREQYGYDVEPPAAEGATPKSEDPPKRATEPERADAGVLPEAAVEPKVDPRTPRTPATRKPAGVKPRPSAGK